MDRLDEEVAPHAPKTSAVEVRKIEIAYRQAFCRAAKAGGARVWAS